jgi:hypothetical protein
MKKSRERTPILTRLLTVSFAILAVGGCTIIHKDIDTPLDLSQSILQEENTHFSSILDQLGPPAKISALPNGMAFLYEYVSITERQIGIGFDAEILKWLKFAIAGASDVRQTLVLVFDEQGMLQTHRFLEHTEDLGKGGAMQLMIAVQQLIDTSHLDDTRGPNEWGTSLLRPVPETLNIHQSLNTGTGGIEQKGTPASIGQHTLEMR